MREEVILWKPEEAFKANSNLHHYIEWLRTDKDLSFEDYASLWWWSIENIADFWKSLWQYFDIQYSGHLSFVLQGENMPAVEWFGGVKVNYAEHIFRHQSDQRPALLYGSERHAIQSISWSELERKVSALRKYFKDHGLKPGDRIAAYLPNTPETIMAFLAANSLGVIWSCCSPDFGSKTVIDRFAQIDPVCFIGVDGYAYNGKVYDRKSETLSIADALDGVRTKLFFNHLYPAQSEPEGWSSLSHVIDENSDGSVLEFERLPFSAPIWILFSSGTTGKPKAITHSHGGVLLEHLKYLHLHNDVRQGETFFWYTTTGWMMWNFLQASMLVGATPLLYEGSPGYPNLNRLWKLADEIDLNHFGTSAPFLIACKNLQISPGRDYDLGTLRSIGSTGSPLPAEAFDWVYAEVGTHIWLCSMSGGTDVCTAFVGGNPYLPVQRGRIQSRALGCALFPYADDGSRLNTGIGEMIIEKPMPSMPVKFWNDPQQQRLRASYYKDFPGKWRHGDFIQLYEDGSLEILGRSDATLNRKGVRIGTAEIYAALDAINEIKDALVLNLDKKNGDDFMPLFVQLTPGTELVDSFIEEIRTTLRLSCSPRHVPDIVLAVPDIPYTLSGKKMEIPVKKILQGVSLEQSAQKDAVRNPAALEYFRDLAEAFSAQHLSRL
ncbi:MAG: acetoacetate--CoA ligase [Saprospiraceae bacterium]|nr:acetoacetate--CoA ligase [Saprospiraceae bacterium]